LKSLRVKLTIIIAVATILVLSVSSFVSYKRAAGTLEEQLFNAAAASAKDNAKVVDQWLQGIINEVKTLAEDADVRSADPERYLPVLKRVLQNHDDYELLYAADREGNGAGTNDTTFSVADRDYFQEATQKGKTVISNVLTSKATGNLIIVVAAPLY